MSEVIYRQEFLSHLDVQLAIERAQLKKSNPEALSGPAWRDRTLLFTIARMDEAQRNKFLRSDEPVVKKIDYKAFVREMEDAIRQSRQLSLV